MTGSTISEAVEAALALAPDDDRHGPARATARRLAALLDDPELSGTAAASVARELRVTLAGLLGGVGDEWGSFVAGFGGPE